MRKIHVAGVGLLSLVIGLITGCVSESGPPAISATPVPTRVEQAPEPPRPGPGDAVERAARMEPAPFDGDGWEPLFDGETPGSWTETPFSGRGEIEIKSGVIVLGMGSPFTGIHWTNDFPKVNYEVALDAMRVMGFDFFCGLTVPVNDTHCSLIVGGWGGGLVGLSSIDGMDASENETTKFLNIEQGKWYRVRVRVTPERIEAWIDGEKLVNLVTTERRISVRPGEIELSQPFGIAAWQTSAALREINWRRVDAPAGPPPK
jgi:hypothetical protein